MPREKMAGVEGVEPSHTAPETAVLPLDDTPNLLPVRLLLFCKAQAQESILRAFPYAVKPLFQLF